MAANTLDIRKYILFIIAGAVLLLWLLMYTDNHFFSDAIYRLPKQDAFAGDGAWHIIDCCLEATDEWYDNGQKGFGHNAPYIASLTYLDAGESWYETKARIFETANNGSKNVSTISYILLLSGGILFLFELLRRISLSSSSE